jgi:hypothetical protein
MEQKQKRERLDDLEVISLFTNICYGLSIPYDPSRVNDVVQLATRLTYPKETVKFDFVGRLLQTITDGQCQSSRTSFSAYDKLLMNALTYVIESCQLPIDGVYFRSPEQYGSQSCCSVIDQFNPGQWNTCVPSEYVLFRADKHLEYYRP